MRLSAISREIEALSARRTALWEHASDLPRGELARQAAALTERIERLWASYRWLRSAARSGSHASIRARARREDEVDRDARRRPDLPAPAAGRSARPTAEETTALPANREQAAAEPPAPAG